MTERVKERVANMSNWTDSTLAKMMIAMIGCSDCPVVKDCTISCNVSIFNWLQEHGDEEVEE